VIDDTDLIARLENLHCRFNLNSLARAEDPPVAAFAEPGRARWRRGKHRRVAGRAAGCGGAGLDGSRDR
jgi:hypothetical protein